jgi:hypothetical protein
LMNDYRCPIHLIIVRFSSKWLAFCAPVQSRH